MVTRHRIAHVRSVGVGDDGSQTSTRTTARVFLLPKVLCHTGFLTESWRRETTPAPNMCLSVWLGWANPME